MRVLSMGATDGESSAFLPTVEIALHKQDICLCLTGFLNGRTFQARGNDLFVASTMAVHCNGNLYIGNCSRVK